MALIDRTYFWGELNPGFYSTAVGTAAILATAQGAELDLFITRYEDEMLTLLLGDLKADYLAGRTTVASWMAVDAYILNATTKTSILADYVFCKFWGSKETNIISDGSTGKSTRKNGVTLSNDARVIPVWKSMIDRVLLLLSYLSENKDELESETELLSEDGWEAFIYYQDGLAYGRYRNSFGL